MTGGCSGVRPTATRPIPSPKPQMPDARHGARRVETKPDTPSCHRPERPLRSVAHDLRQWISDRCRGRLDPEIVGQ
jgi:hypothetical protein